MAKISVIVPVHDSVDYLAECLASIECQTVRDIEVLCIDDASADASPKVLEIFAERDPRFKVHRFEESHGVSAVRNEGIRRATGDYIAFMDDDDWYPESTSLEKLYAPALEAGALISGGSFSDYDNRLDKVICDYPEDEHISCFTFRRSGMVPYREWQGDYGFQRFLFKRDFLNEEHLEFPALARHEDPVFLVRAMIAAGEFHAVPDVVYRHRIHHKSHMMRAETIDDAYEAIAEILALSYEHDLKQLRAWQKELLQWYAAESIGLIFHERELFAARAKVLNEVARSKPVRLVSDLVGSYRVLASDVLAQFHEDDRPTEGSAS